MAKVEVKCVEGRVAFTAPQGGARIPADKYVTVTLTPWIERLLDHHGDIELKPEETVVAAAPAKKSKPLLGESTVEVEAEKGTN